MSDTGFGQDDTAALEAAGFGDSGFHIEYPDGGYDRPIETVENDAEIELLFSGGGEHRLTCGYCSGRYRTASRSAALTWWKAHDCAVLEAREAIAMVYDLSPLLSREGRPLAA